MIQINDKTFYSKPGSCGTCPFFDNGRTSTYPGTLVGFCGLFGENHKSYINPPRRCQKLFNKAFRFPDGSKLIIVANDNK